MKTLKEFLNYKIYNNEMINNININLLFSHLVKQSNEKKEYIKLYLNNNGDIYPEAFGGEKLKKLFKSFRKDKEYIILIINADVVIPPLKNEILLSHENYNVKRQEEENKKDFLSKLQIDFFDLIPDNVTIFCQQIHIDHVKINYIPLGTQINGHDKYINFKDIKLDLSKIKKNEKNILCYLNCNTNKNGLINFIYGNIRELCYNFYKDKDFVKSETYQTIKGQNKKQKFKSYYEVLGRSKFCLCPPINCPDTYRIWDCLYMGCIPIVINSDMKKYLDDLPIWFIDDFFSLTEEKLNNKWDEMKDKKYNYDKLYFSYWKNLII